MINALLLIVAACAPIAAHAGWHYEYNEMGIPQRVENRADTAATAAPYVYDCMDIPHVLNREECDSCITTTTKSSRYEYDGMGIPKRTKPSAARSQPAKGTAAP